MKKPTVRYASDDEMPVDDFWSQRESLAYKAQDGGLKPKELTGVIDLPIYINYRMSDGGVKVRQTSLYLDDCSYDSKDAEINLAKLVVRLPVPDVDMEQCTSRLVEALEKEKKQILADAHMRAMKLDNKIKDLLAITHQPEDGEENAD